VNFDNYVSVKEYEKRGGGKEVETSMGYGM